MPGEYTACTDSHFSSLALAPRNARASHFLVARCARSSKTQCLKTRAALHCGARRSDALRVLARAARRRARTRAVRDAARRGPPQPRRPRRACCERRKALSLTLHLKADFYDYTACTDSHFSSLALAPRNARASHFLVARCARSSKTQCLKTRAALHCGARRSDALRVLARAARRRARTRAVRDAARRGPPQPRRPRRACCERRKALSLTLHLKADFYDYSPGTTSPRKPRTSNLIPSYLISSKWVPRARIGEIIN